MPYFDKVAFQVVDSKLIPAKTEAGESMLQGKDLKFADYTFLKEGEKDGGYYVLLWRNSPGSNLTLYPNLTTKDPVWRELNRDVRYRRALSLAIDRHRDQPGRLLRPGAGGREHRAAGKPAVQAGLSGGLCHPQHEGSQPPAGRDRPDQAR